MWFDEKQPVKGSILGVWLRPYFAKLMLKVVRSKSEDWRYNLAKWAWAPLVHIEKPKWFSQFVVTLCTEPKDEQSAK
jgi:hypothetical protein